MKKAIVLGLLIFSMFFTFANQNNTDNLSNLNGKRLGILTGSNFDTPTKLYFPDSEYYYFNNIPDLTRALLDGKIDSFMYDEPILRYIKVQNPNIDYYNNLISKDDYGFGIAKTEQGLALKKDFDLFLTEYKNSGKLKELEEKWFIKDPSVYTVDYQSLPDINGTIIAAGECLNPPFSFVSNGKLIGYEIELLYEYCKSKGYSLQLIGVEATSRVSYLVSGKADLSFGCMTITEERKKSILFTEPVYVGGSVMAKVSDTWQTIEKPGFFESVSQSFYRNFVEEERYKMILSGLLVTIRISVFSAIFGSLLGFGLCMQKRLKNKFLSTAASVFIRLIQGLPLVVFLMILYYIVFKKSRIPAEIIAIIGFSINFGAYVSEMIRTGIEAVDKGQIEAALSMGFNPVKTFMKITFPQAAKHFIPVYRGEFISMVKMTSVVGYIAIQDITKVSDIIRSRTYDAFFPLICTALLYFIVTYIFVFILNRVELILDPQRKKRIIKGVVVK